MKSGILKLESPGLPDGFHVRVISPRQIKRGGALSALRGRGSPALARPAAASHADVDKGKAGKAGLQNWLVRPGHAAWANLHLAYGWAWSLPPPPRTGVIMASPAPNWLGEGARRGQVGAAARSPGRRDRSDPQHAAKRPTFPELSPCALTGV